jgi:D-apionolactonase
VMQTLETLPHIFASAKKFIGKVKYHLGPSGIAARDNPYGSATLMNETAVPIALADCDPRQSKQFAAAWNFGLLARAANAGVKSVALSDAVGSRGLVQSNGTINPIFNMFVALAPFAGSKLIQAHASHEDKILPLAFESKNRRYLWAANLTPEVQVAKLAGSSTVVRLTPYAVTELGVQK